MFKVKVQAKPRSAHGQQFNHFWSAGIQWPCEVTERLVTQEQKDELLRDEKAEMPIRVLAFVEVPDKPADEVLAPFVNLAPTIPATVVITSTPPTVTPVLLVGSAPKPPWESGS